MQLPQVTSARVSAGRVFGLLKLTVCRTDAMLLNMPTHLRAHAAILPVADDADVLVALAAFADGSAELTPQWPRYVTCAGWAAVATPAAVGVNASKPTAAGTVASAAEPGAAEAEGLGRTLG